DVPAAVAAGGLKNYWGYSSCAFYAPHPRYAVDPAHAPLEFQQCVHALHEAGLGVILDVVFNHTSEGGADGPTIHFKSIAGDAFYHRDPARGARHPPRTRRPPPRHHPPRARI